MNEIELVEAYTIYLKDHHIEFYEDGFPKLKSEWFIQDSPSIIAPFNKRHYYQQKKKDISIIHIIMAALSSYSKI